MTDFNFPTNPQLDDEHTQGDTTYIWDGIAWNIIGPDIPITTIEVENTVTGLPGTEAIVENVGTPTTVLLDFTIPRGDKGFKGDVGPRGVKGFKGEVGQKGQKGEIGQKGQKGLKGEKGQKGTKGEIGQKGEIGIGLQGIKGDQGYKGEAGVSNNPGPPGATGAQGASGINGTPGSNGGPGPQGSQGPKGAQGVPGTTTGGSQNLQQVCDIGNTTTTDIFAKSIIASADVSVKATMYCSTNGSGGIPSYALYSNDNGTFCGNKIFYNNTGMFHAQKFFTFNKGTYSSPAINVGNFLGGLWTTVNTGFHFGKPGDSQSYLRADNTDGGTYIEKALYHYESNALNLGVSNQGKITKRSSSRRTAKNVTTLTTTTRDGSVENLLDNILPKSFIPLNTSGEGTVPIIGLLAEDVYEVAPGLVIYDYDNYNYDEESDSYLPFGEKRPQAVDFDRVTTLLLAAFKLERAKVKLLTEEVTLLKDKVSTIDDLEQQLIDLKTQLGL